jgi:hypothetical protein
MGRLTASGCSRLEGCPQAGMTASVDAGDPLGGDPLGGDPLGGDPLGRDPLGKKDQHQRADRRAMFCRGAMSMTGNADVGDVGRLPMWPRTRFDCPIAPRHSPGRCPISSVRAGVACDSCKARSPMLEDPCPRHNSLPPIPAKMPGCACAGTRIVPLTPQLTGAGDRFHSLFSPSFAFSR